ncbi:MAG: tyrosine-protein phosphatase [Rhodospirillales bacterium]|nr:tyrosine-protein phosphatase [Rhodospirillales bacterium]
MDEDSPPLPRVIPLEGASNVRDLGGWPTRDGRRVRFGQVFRAARLARITEADTRALQGLGLRTVVDLRGADERAKVPNVEHGFNEVTLSIEPSIGPRLREMAESGEGTAEEMRAMMARAYAAYAIEWAAQYRALFTLLLSEQRVPLLFHCTAGKDRTGFGAALILAALGVREEAIREDYLATTRLWVPDEDVASTLPEEAARMLQSVHSSLLGAAFDAIHQWHGTLEAYLLERIGLDTARLEMLRARLLD